MTPGRWSHVPAKLFHLIPQRFVQTFWSTDSALSFSQGLICSHCKVLMLTADRLKTSSTEQPSQVRAGAAAVWCCCVRVGAWALVPLLCAAAAVCVWELGCWCRCCARLLCERWSLGAGAAAVRCRCCVRVGAWVLAPLLCATVGRGKVSQGSLRRLSFLTFLNLQPLLPEERERESC